MSRNKCFLGVAVLVLLAAVSQAQQTNCSDATLNGSYGLHATGTVIGVGDFAAVGRFVFDGKGNLTATLFVRVNGNNMTPPQLTGTYSVSPDCTVTDSWGGSTHVSVITDNGKGYFILNNTSGEGDTISGEGRRNKTPAQINSDDHNCS